MTLLPLNDCCLLLGVDPKTLRLWLKAAHLSWTLHPGDARLKCLTPPQLHQLAELHGRCLPSALPSAISPLVAPLTGAAVPPQPCAPASACACADPELRHHLSLLQTQVVSLQEQVTHLALALLCTHQWHWPAAPVPGSAPLSCAAASPATVQPGSADEAFPSRCTATSQPLAAGPARAASRPRSQPLPLIEYGADGQYVIISPTQGVLSLVPASPAWFDWLSSLTAFTFQGVGGRFSTTRKLRQGQRVQAWSAYRSLHGRSCTLYLGLTSHLTLARLEEMAATIHARLTTS